MDIEQVISEFRGMFQQLVNIQDNQQRTLDKILKEQASKEDRYIVRDLTIPKGSYEESPAISNTHYEKARIFANAEFGNNATGGISIDLYWGNTRIMEVLRLKPSQASGNGASQPFDIAQLSGFRFVFINHDAGQNFKINNVRIVLYNEK